MTTKERPILFSGEMVHAILEGRKTQTRRVLSKQPLDVIPYQGELAGQRWVGLMQRDPNKGLIFKCKYGQAGDRLWVRETFCVGYEYEPGNFTALPFHGCDNTRKAFYRATDDDAPEEPKRPWKPSIHMPRWASRITLQIKAVRVERLQEITYGDVLDEGIKYRGSGDHDAEANGYEDFISLWDGINAKRGYGWDVNPWVWVIEFKVVTQ
jgi:hypothetical protein